ncbi:DinB family protein [Streptomyces sp. A012304]|uniref:DinB family protein n=1 Tax=Streptomyces sp. A012304 TaxID=375446 RepID=UPI00222F0A9C|nr:DinB family protein [Streptomyces sp. A012304]
MSGPDARVPAHPADYPDFAGPCLPRCAGLDAAAVVRVIEEYARRNGHADFPRERVDGRIGR